MKRRDYRGAMVVLLPILLGAVAGLLAVLPERSQPIHADPVSTAAERGSPAYPGELHQRFQQAAVMLHAGQFLYALEAVERVLDLAPDMPEGHVNAGFALLGLAHAERARHHFEFAVNLRPTQVNAYYGLALALESLGDLDGALGAMRTYVHLADDRDQFQRRAWAAIWEWQSQRSAQVAGPRDGAVPIPDGGS